MKQISTSLTSKLKQDTIVERDYIIFSGETTRHYIWFNLYDDCYNNGNFIGTFVMKRVEFTYKDSDLEFKNKEFNAYKEYKLDDGTWEAINYGTFVVTNIEPSDTKEEITVTAYDYALKFANTYKTDLDYASGKITLFQVLQEVCQKVGVELENTSIDNGNFIVDSNQFGENTLYGNVITAIAQMSCDFAKITSENKLKLLFKTETNIIIETKDYEEFEDKRDTLPYNAVSLGITDVDGENVSLIAPGVEPDDAKFLIINDSPFAYTQEKRTQLIQEIFDKINGFGYSSFVLSNCLYPQLECGDLVKIRNKDGQLVNSIVLRPTFEEVVLNFEAPSTITSSVSYVQPVDAIDIAKRTEIIVNKQEQTIQSVVSEVGQYDERITNVEQSVDKIEQEVSQITVPIQDISGNGSIIFENASNTAISKLSIKGDISLLFGNDGKQYGELVFFSDDLYFNDNQYFSNGVPYAEILYPSSTLFGKNMNLLIEYEDETQTIKLPFTYLNYISQDICDEFKIENGRARVIRRVGINSNMEKYQLSREVIEDLGEFEIILKEGSPKFYLQCFDSAIYSATYMVKNEYTDTFATKIELNSSITQTKDEINLEVSKKVDENEIISAINLTSEEAKINAQKITLEGIVTANENFKVLEDGSIEAVNGSFNGNIYLGNGGIVVGGDGIMSTMIVNANIWSSQFIGGSGFMPLGFEVYSGSGVKNYQMIEFVIPENFVVKKAFIYLKHVPLTSQLDTTYQGYSRNINAYLCDDNSFNRTINYYGGLPTVSGNYYKINNCFGANGFTGSLNGLTETISIDISSYINQSKTYSIKLQSDYTGATSAAASYQATGCILAELYITGYTSEQIN